MQHGQISIIDLCSICVFNWIPNNKLKVFIYFPSLPRSHPPATSPLSPASFSPPPSLFSTINYSDTSSIILFFNHQPMAFCALWDPFPSNRILFLCLDVSVSKSRRTHNRDRKIETVLFHAT